MEANQGNVISFKMYFLQNDWNDVLASNHGSNESIWLFVKELTNSKAKEYKLKTVKNNSLVLEVPTDEFTIVSCSNRCFVVEDQKSKIQHRFLPPLTCYSSIHNKSINSLDVAPSGIAVSSSDGAAKVWDTVNGQNKHNLEGHFLDVNKCKFFPSNEVILTAGADMQMKIWSAIDGKCPVTLLGHKGAINDVAIVDRGRNIISVGGDGLVKLWSCAKAQCIENIFDITTQDDHGPNRSINVCKIRSINSTSLDIGVREEPISEGTVGTEDKLLLCGTESGFVYCISVHTKKVIFKVKCDSAVNSVQFHKNHHFVYGTQSGDLFERDLRKPEQPISRWCFSKSPVLSIMSLCRPFSGVLVGRQDGTVTFVYDDQKQVIHLTGSDCDPVYDLAYDSKFIYSACRDGKVRKYLLNNAFE